MKLSILAICGLTFGYISPAAHAEDISQCAGDPAPIKVSPVLSSSVSLDVSEPAQRLLENPVTTDTAPGPTANLSVASDYFKSKGYKCGEVTPRKGLNCVGRIDGYPQDVAFLIPPNYHVEDQTDLILHLHGHTNFTQEPLNSMLGRYGYAESLAATHRNAIMVAPWSSGKCTDFQDNLQEKEQFQGFVDKITKMTHEASLSTSTQVGSIALTGHSGAYRTIAGILSNGGYADRVGEVYLFDSAYGRSEQFSAWASQPHHRLWSVYHKDYGDLNKTAKEMKKNIGESGVGIYNGTVSAITTSRVRATQVGFIPALYTADENQPGLKEIDHDSTFKSYFRTLLGTVK